MGSSRNAEWGPSTGIINMPIGAFTPRELRSYGLGGSIVLRALSVAVCAEIGECNSEMLPVRCGDVHRDLCQPNSQAVAVHCWLAAEPLRAATGDRLGLRKGKPKHQSSSRNACGETGWRNLDVGRDEEEM